MSIAAPEVSVMAAKIMEYTSLNSTPGIHLNFSSQSKAQKPDSEYVLDDICGQTFQNTMKSAVNPMTQSVPPSA